LQEGLYLNHYSRDRECDRTCIVNTSTEFCCQGLDNYFQVFGELRNSSHRWTRTTIQKPTHLRNLDPKIQRSSSPLLSAFNGAVMLGHIHIMIATMTLLRFHPAPRLGHLKCMKLRTRIPEHEATHRNQDYDWNQTVYGNVKK